MIYHTKSQITIKAKRHKKTRTLLILVFVIMQRYEALGLLIAAKSIIRFGEKETTKTEYVLAGTLMSIFIAVLAGLMVRAF